MMLTSVQTVPSTDIFSDSSVCPDCLDPVGLCNCSWQIMQLDASYSIYTALNDETAGKPTSVSSACTQPHSLPYYMSSMHELDGLNCGGIPTRTTPTLTPTLRNFEADIANLTHGTSEDFAVAAASDLHHLVSASCSSINVPSSENIDRLNSDLQNRHNLQNLNIQHISLQNINTQNIIINNLPSHQHMNQNTLNQQQRNDYNNSFSVAPSRQAGFVPPLVLQINSSNSGAQQQSGTTVLSNSNNSSIFSSKSLSTSTSASHWQGAVVTQRPQQRTRNAVKRSYTDDEDGDEDFDSGADEVTDDSSDTTSGKMARKSNTKNNKSNSKTNIKSESKSANTTSNAGRGRANKNNKIMSAEEEQRRQIRRERNKMAAARCRKRRMDHTNELLEETEQLEDKRLQLQVEIESLHLQKTNLQQMLAQHKCVVNMNNRPVSNTVSSVNNVATVLDSNAIPESSTSVLTIDSSSSNRNLQQQSTSIKTDDDAIDNILIKCEESVSEDNKDDVDIIPTSVMQQISKRRPTTLLELNSGNYGNCKKISGNDSNGGVVVLNFDSLMDGRTGLTPISTSVGSVQSQQRSNTNSGNNNVLS